MVHTVNGLIGSDVCMGMSAGDVMLIAVSAPLIISGNMVIISL